MGHDEFAFFDADNHYYEPEDAFTRYADQDVRRFVRWVSEGKKRHIVFGTVMSTSLPNPTFDPVAKPGAFHKRLKELAEGGDARNVTLTDSRRYGELEPLPPHYRDRDAWLAVMDEQNLEKALLFPTLGVGIEGLNPTNAEMTYKLFHAFNLWLEDDWGFAYKNRIFAAPHIPMLEPTLATAELASLLERGCRLVALRPGPAAGRSPADVAWDPFWSLLNDAGIPAAYHAYAGPDRYGAAFQLLWQHHGIGDAPYERNLQAAWIGDRPMLDTAIALVLGNLFGRFPRLRIVSVELGCAWVPYCMHVLDHAGGLLDRHIEAFGETIAEKPSELFKRHFWVSPFPEENLMGLADLVGVDHVLFGSDWPHAEGTAQPADCLPYVNKLGTEATRKIMRENAETLFAS